MKHITSTFAPTAPIVLALSIGMLALVVLLTPALSQAATYAYVGQDNRVKIVTASNPTVAIATAPGILANSGVFLVDSSSSGTIAQGTSQGTSYAYVGTDNYVKMVYAIDAATALRTASGIHLNSGVFLMESASDDAAIGERV